MRVSVFSTVCINNFSPRKIFIANYFSVERKIAGRSWEKVYKYVSLSALRPNSNVLVNFRG
jgi:hypothetical protein